MDNPDSLEKFREMESELFIRREVPSETTLAWRYGIEPEHAGLVRNYLRFYLNSLRENLRPRFTDVLPLALPLVGCAYAGRGDQHPSRLIPEYRCGCSDGLKAQADYTT